MSTATIANICAVFALLGAARQIYRWLSRRARAQAARRDQFIRGIHEQARTAAVLDPLTLSEIDMFTYEGEGWGICFDGEYLVMSDGSDRLTLRSLASLLRDLLGRPSLRIAGDVTRQGTELQLRLRAPGGPALFWACWLPSEAGGGSLVLRSGWGSASGRVLLPRSFRALGNHLVLPLRPLLPAPRVPVVH